MALAFPIPQHIRDLSRRFRSELQQRAKRRRVRQGLRLRLKKEPRCKIAPAEQLSSQSTAHVSLNREVRQIENSLVCVRAPLPVIRTPELTGAIQRSRVSPACWVI